MTTTETQSLTHVVEGNEVPLPGTYAVDPSHSSVEAIARHLMVTKVRGRFGVFSGTIEVADRIEDSSVSIEIDASSIDTRDEGRDGHLRSGDFLDVERFPTLTFVSTAVEPAGGRWKVTGDLTIRGVSRPVELDVEFLGAFTDPWGNAKTSFNATTEIDREEFGITWNQALESGGVLVSRKLKIELEVQAAAS